MTTKRLTELTISDLQNEPVWEHWYEEGIEYVRPTNKIEINEDDNIGLILLTDFTINNGQMFVGFCSPQDTSGLDYIQPVIIAANGQLGFWKYNDWTKEEKKEVLDKLGLEWQQVFPIHYKTRIQCNGKLYNGTIKDFNKD
jgi:hypothetical protein